MYHDRVVISADIAVEGEPVGSFSTPHGPNSSRLVVARCGLFAVFAALFLLHLGATGVIDYDEACYAEVSRAMHVSGEWLAPTLNEEPFFEKPPLVYWAQIAGYHLFGVGPWGARFFNALAALGILAAVFGFSRRPFGERGAWIATIALGTSLEFFALARVTLTDTFLSLWFVLCLGCFHRARVRFDRDGGGHSIFWLACFFGGLATLTKGAIGFVLPAAAAITLQVIERRARPLLSPKWFIPGAAILLGVGFSWYVALGVTEERGFAFMRELFWEHHVGRFAKPMQGHSGPIFFYLPVLLVGFLPWSPFAVLALGRALRRESTGERAAFVRLYLIFAGWTLLLFSLAATKLPNYVAPILPALAIAVGEAWDARWGGDPTRGDRRAAAVTSGLLLGFAAIFAALPIVVAELPRFLGEAIRKEPGLLEPIHLGIVSFVAAVVLAAGGIQLWRARRNGQTDRLFTIPAASIAAFLLILGCWLLPIYDDATGAPLRAAALAADATLPAGEPILLVGIRHKPSVRYVTGRRTEYRSRRDEAQLAALFGESFERVAIATEEDLDRVLKYGEVDVIGRFNGYVVFRPIRPDR